MLTTRLSSDGSCKRPRSSARFMAGSKGTSIVKCAGSRTVAATKPGPKAVAHVDFTGFGPSLMFVTSSMVSLCTGAVTQAGILSSKALGMGPVARAAPAAAGPKTTPRPRHGRPIGFCHFWRDGVVFLCCTGTIPVHRD